MLAGPNTISELPLGSWKILPLQTEIHFSLQFCIFPSIFRTLMHKTFTAKKLSPNGNVSGAREKPAFRLIKMQSFSETGRIF